jgi:thioredoxin-like negative regulator of GroEL
MFWLATQSYPVRIASATFLFVLFASSLTAARSCQSQGSSISNHDIIMEGEEEEAEQHYQNAVSAINKGDWATAKSELQQAGKLAPQNALVHYDLALAYSHTGSPRSAQAELDKALHLGLPADQKQAADKLRQKLVASAGTGSKSKPASVQTSPQEQSVHAFNALIHHQISPIPTV